MPHLAAGFNLARWLVRGGADAEDVVQEAALRAFQALDDYRGGNPRAWVLTIVRNTCYSWLRRSRAFEAPPESNDESVDELAGDPGSEPEARLLRAADRQVLHDALEALPVPFREALVLRELEGFSYKEIADIADIPVGTVMSRLARARRQMQEFILRSSKDDR